MEALLGTIITYTKGNWQGGMSILGIVLSAYTAYTANSNKMNDTAFSEWVRISGDKITVYTHPKQYRIFVWVLFFISQLVLVYKVYDQEQEQVPWFLWLLIPLGIGLLFQATRKVIFKLKEQTFAVKIYGITMRKKTWQKVGMYTIRQRSTQDDNTFMSSRSYNEYLLHLHFDVGKVWVAQARQAADLKPLAIALQEMLEAVHAL
jgi:hypothetical protein